MRILRKTGLWIATLLYLVLVLGFVSSKYEGQLCNTLAVNIEDSTSIGFLSKADVLDMLNKQDLRLYGMPLQAINLGEIESVIQANQIVKSCKAYTGINGTLHVDITQREPFVRVLEKSGKSFYFDREGNVLNPSSSFSPHVLVMNGNIRSGLRIGQPANVYELADSQTSDRLKELFELARFIDASTFWKAQIVQVYCNASGEYELIPRIGPHVILLGSMERYRQKFGKLKVFYEEGLNTVGWNHYLKINLKYKDQVVCTKI